MNFADTYLGQLRQKVGTALIQVPGGRIVMESPSDERILLQKRSDYGIWGLPAGSPELSESAVESIRREVLEETGLIVEQLDCFGYASNPEFEIVTYPNGDQIHNYSLLFYTQSWTGELIESNEESLALQFFTMHDLPEVLPNHLRTLYQYQAFKQTGIFQMD